MIPQRDATGIYPEISCLLFSAFVPADLNNICKTLMLNREWDVVHAEQAVKWPVVKAMADAARAVATG